MTQFTSKAAERRLLSLSVDVDHWHEIVAMMEAEERDRQQAAEWDSMDDMQREIALGNTVSRILREDRQDRESADGWILHRFDH